MKSFSASICLALALLGFSERAEAQLSVGPGGLAAQAFNSAPAASQFSTRTVGPVSPGVITSGSQLDGAVQTNTAASINLALPTSAAVPPTNSGFAQWNSTGLYLQSRATTNWYTLLMATLQNNTGSNIVILNLSYDFATAIASGVLESVPGLRAYFSLTGAQNSWTRIPELDSANAIESGPKSAAINLGGWAPGASLYIVWADPNASGAASGEGPYTIDNLSATAVPVQPGPPNIVSHPQSQTVGYPNQVVFSVSALGSTPFYYQWFKDSTAIGGATGSSYTINNATLADQGTYYVVVSNALGTATSSNAVLTVTCPGGTTTPSITTQPADQSTVSGATLTLSVVASGTTPTYQWYRGGTAISGATSSTYSKANAQPSDSGLYSAVVANCAGTVVSRSAVVSVAQPGYTIVPLTTHTWRYNEANTDLGTVWRETGYNDASWLSGRGVFAFENNAAITPLTNTVLTLGSPDIPTHYFRTTFTLTNDPATVTLTASNLIDDGAVVYLNGVEAFRYNMPTGREIRFGDLALAANPAGEGTFIISNFPANLVREGQNVIAVEVHQNSLDSSDKVFGMAVLVNVAAPAVLEITEHPQNLVVEETKPATFTVGVQGVPRYFQWYRNGTPIPNATTNPFTIPVTTTNDAGSYFVVVTNAINSVTSAVATLTIIPDTNAPTLVEADGTISNTLVLVSFSELVSASATNVANYKITNTLGGTLVISRAVITNGTNVLLTTATARQPNNNYLVIVNNVTDVSPRANMIAPNSMYPIRSLVSLVGLTSPWRFYDPYPPFDDPADLGTAWRERNYTEITTWADGTSIFWFGDPSVVPGSAVTSLSQTPLLITYFRSAFNFQASRGGLRLLLTHVMDDGAVVYLNGSEAYRFNMPSGTINYNTPASSIVGDPARVGPIEIPSNGLMGGSNVIAVELHQNQNIDLDKFFGLQLDASVQSYVAGPVVIAQCPRDVTVPEGAPATFGVVQVGGLRFQWYSNTAPATLIAGATNDTYTIPVTTLAMDGARFSVLVTNGLTGPTAGAMSCVATLRVVADTNRPVLLAGKLGTNNNTVILSFSEPMAASTANDRLNYVVTNAAGASASITSAALLNGTNVVLTFGSALNGRYTVVVNNLRDTATVPNLIQPNSAVTVGADYLIALDSKWKYLLTATNEAIQSAFTAPAYDDTAWRGPSNALLYVEDATLPGPKSTPLSLTAPGGEYIRTFYFRQKFVVPVAATNVVMRIRHVIDDGFALHLNGVEIFRFNLGTAPLTAATEAPANTGDAVLVGPADIVVTNLIGGTNVFAAEVHQNGNASSDVTFGVELSFSVPSVVIQPPQGVQILNQPQSRTNAIGTAASFSVAASGATPLFYQWQKGTSNIGGATNSTHSIGNVQSGDAGQYRVIVSNSFSSVTSLVATLTVTGGGNCTNVAPRLAIDRSGANLVLSWSNPTNSCGAIVPYILRSTTALPIPPSPGVWTTNVSSSPVSVGPTNAARFFQLIKQ